jgi:methoxymalonate biosynthesis acyl carrier protein
VERIAGCEQDGPTSSRASAITGEITMLETVRMTQPKVQVREFVDEQRSAIAGSDRQDLVALGAVDPLFIMETVVFLEDRFGIRVPNEEMRLDSFRSVDAMTALVERLLPVAA